MASGVCRRHARFLAVLVHPDRNHLDAEMLADPEVPVIAGARAEERRVVLLDPGRRSAGDAVQHRAPDRVTHQVEAGVAADDYFVESDFHHRGEEVHSLVVPVNLRLWIGAVNAQGRTSGHRAHWARPFGASKSQPFRVSPCRVESHERWQNI